MILELRKDSKKDVHKILKQHNNVTILYHSNMPSGGPLSVDNVGLY